jgi:hypothetical protein
LDHCAVDGTGRLDLPALNFFECAKVVKVDLGPQHLELSKTKQNERFLSPSKSVLQLLNGQLFQWIPGLPLNPFVHFLFAKTSLIDLPIPTTNVPIDRERWVVPVYLELVGRNIQKLQPFEELIVGGDQLLEYLVLWGIAIAVEYDCYVLGFDLLEEFVLFFDHQRSRDGCSEE